MRRRLFWKLRNRLSIGIMRVYAFPTLWTFFLPADEANCQAGCIRSWDQMLKTDNQKSYTRQNMDEHYLVIIDNMVHRMSLSVWLEQVDPEQMNLDMLYLATDLTKDPKYARIATRQAERSMDTHVRPDGTTYHVVNMDQTTGKALEQMTHQGGY